MKSWLRWTASFLSLPIGGYLALLLIGPVDGIGPALLAGLLTGAVIGTGQSLLSSKRLDPRRWIPATTIGVGLGLPFGAALVDYRTGLADLVLMGLVNGALLGIAQAVVLRKWQWAVAMPLLWALGWAVTTVAGIDVDEQFSVFGSSGAVVFAALSGLLLHRLVPVRPPLARPRKELGDPDQPHTYTYIPDIGEGLAVLGVHPAGSGTCPTTRTPGPPANSPAWPTGRPAGPGSGSGRCRRCCCGWPVCATRRSGRSSRWRTCSRSRSWWSSRITAELGGRATPAEQAIAETLAGYCESRTGGTRASAARDSGRPTV